MGAVADGSTYKGKTYTEGFSNVRLPGEAISVMLVLEDGQVAYGDCAAVQYSGAAGRDPLFVAAEFIPVIEKHITPMLVGAELNSFKELAKAVENYKVNGKKLHTAIRYGVSQAILAAVAKAKNKMMCDVIAEEYQTKVATDMSVGIFTQSGDNRYDNADKMILKSVPVMPHALINTDAKLGANGEVLLDYVKWLVKRIAELRQDKSYQPIIHLDVYGTIGSVFGAHNYEAMANYIATLEAAAKPYQLRIEGPMDCDTYEDQVVALSELTKLLDARGLGVELVADEWCNTLEEIKEFADKKAGHMVQIKTPDLGSITNSIEAVLYCKAKGMGAYQGGTCNETERSAQICVHMAMATQPQQILAKPGMGVDEPYMIVYNEMQRIIALHK